MLAIFAKGIQDHYEREYELLLRRINESKTHNISMVVSEVE